MTEANDATPDSGRGCLTLLAVFLVISLAGTLVTLTLFALVVQEWELMGVPREFGFDMIVYAPLSGLVCGFAAVFWAARGGPSARWTPLLLGLSLVIAVALLLVFFGLGAVL